MSQHQQQALSVLKATFGYDGFKGEQLNVILNTLNQQNSFVLVPTGGGKSLCYQIPALMLEGLAIVVSPLIALMQDQVATLKQLGVATAYLASSLDIEQNRLIHQQIKAAKLKILYITPEKAINPWFLNFLSGVKLSLIAIDEAHCVSHWGHDFRPEYQRISLLINKFNTTPRLALTATADKYTSIDIIHYLALENATLFSQSFARDNLYYMVEEKNNSKKQLIEFLNNNPYKSGIIYCNSRRRVDELTDYLLSEGLNVRAYHAGLPTTERETNQYYFLQNNHVIMIATVAFGLGIDKPDVRFVYHFDMPKSIEQFYQESGRAGRDSLPALSVINFGFKEIIELSNRIIMNEASELKKRYDLNKLKQMVKYCDTNLCRNQMLLGALDEIITTTCGKCDNCTTPATMVDQTITIQKILSTIYHVKQNFSISHIIDILRGKKNITIQIWEHENISTFGLCSDIPAKALRRIMRQLYTQDIIDFDFKHNHVKLTALSLPILRKTQDIYLATKSIKANLGLKSQIFWLRTELEEQIYKNIGSWRQYLAIKEQISQHAILSDKAIYEIVKQKPLNISQLANIPGIGKVKLTRYAKDILTITTSMVNKAKQSNLTL